ncbi:MAG TPA: M42 family metallopeptidase [Chitinophagaceae bacterium]|nr:M42 family metallopeptidase [Chitinophagaceae bacterium]
MPTKDNAKQNIFSEDAQTFLEKYLNNAAPTGYESGGQKLWLDYIKPYIDDYFVDPYGSVAGIINPGASFKVVIEAHADEISWYVNYITDDGLMYVTRNGGSDHQIAPGMRVNIQTDNGAVKAVFGWPAIHTRKHAVDTKEAVPKLDNIFLDCGATSKEEVEALGIHVGCVATFVDGYEELANDRFICRALDNRAGGFMIAEVARKLKENKKELPFSLYVVNAVQEEVGLRGAEMISRRIKPDVAIVTDVTHDTTTPMINKKVEGDNSCGKGPVLSYAPAVHNLLLKSLRASADKNNISYQLQAANRITGTDTDAFAYSSDGIPSALISLPLRYMHTTVEMVSKKDVEATIDLMYHALLDIQPDMKLTYL